MLLHNGGREEYNWNSRNLLRSLLVLSITGDNNLTRSRQFRAESPPEVACDSSGRKLRPVEELAEGEKTLERVVEKGDLF